MAKYLLLLAVLFFSLRLGYVAGIIAGRRRLARELRPLITDMKALVIRLNQQ